MHLRGLAYARGGGGGGGGVERPIHFHCILHAKRKGGGGGVQITCKIAYIIYGRRLMITNHEGYIHSEGSLRSGCRCSISRVGLSVPAVSLGVWCMSLSVWTGL